MSSRCSYCGHFINGESFSCSNCSEEIYCQWCLPGHQSNKHQIFFPQGSFLSGEAPERDAIGIQSFGVGIDRSTTFGSTLMGSSSLERMCGIGIDRGDFSPISLMRTGDIITTINRNGTMEDATIMRREPKVEQSPTE